MGKVSNHNSFSFKEIFFVPVLLSSFICLYYNSFAITYYSRQTGDWDITTSWSTVACGNATNTGTVPGTGDVCFICNTHIITVTADVNTVGDVTVQSGGYLKVGGSGGGANKFLKITGTFTIDNGGTCEYNTNDDAEITIFNGTESFGISSTFIVTSWSAYTNSIVTGCGSNFGNLTLNWGGGPFYWQCTNLGITNTINGNFTLGSSANPYLDNTAGNQSITIGGNLSNSGNLYVKHNVSGDITLNITGDLTNNGNLFVKNDNTGNAILSVTGNTTLSGPILRGVYNDDGNFTFSTANLYITGGSGLKVFVGTNGKGSCDYTITGVFDMNTGVGQFMGNDYGIVGNWGITTYNIGSVDFDGGSIIFHSTDITDGRTVTINITNNFDLNFTDAGDFVWFSNLTGGTQNQIYDFNVGGDFIISGLTTADFETKQDGSGTDYFDITGNMNISGGISYFSTDGTGTFACTIGGNVTISSGTLNFSTLAASKIDLTVGTASVNWNQTGGTVSLCNTNILSGKTVTLNGTNMGAIQASRTITVKTGGLLYCANKYVSGTGAVTTESGSTLGLGAVNAEGALTSTASAGNIQVTGARTYNAGATYIYNGSAEQYTGNQLPTPITGTLEIYNTSGTGANLTQATTISGTLTLTDGNLITTAANILTMDAGSSVSPVGGSAPSYVDGPMKKTGTTAFTFPVGDGGWWRRVAVGTPTASVTFTAEYVKAAYSDVSIKTEANQMDAISVLEHWKLDEDIATVDATVTLYWQDANASGIDDCPDIVIAHYDGFDWENPYDGSFSTTGSCIGTNNGSVSTTVNVTAFSPFTFGSKGAFKNPLPVVLLSFYAYPGKDFLQLNWETASEINNSYFTIERSIDGKEFSVVLDKIPSKAPGGNSSVQLEYADRDTKPYKGVSYYRLKQTDYDGKYAYSDKVSVKLAENEVTSLYVYPNPANKKLNIVVGENEKSVVKIYDITGQVISENVLCNRATGLCQLEIANLAAGVYFVSLFNGVDTKYARFVKD